MGKAAAIAHKELKELFGSSMAYILLFITIAVFNLFFFFIIDQDGEATLRDVFKVMEFMFVFLMPLLTMRSFAQERASGSFEFLMTSSVSASAVVVGKFLGLFLFYALILALTAPYYILLEVFAQPDRAAILSGYIGLLLEGALFIAIGNCISALTRSQVIAAISSYIVLFLLYFSVSFLKYTEGAVEEIFRAVSVWGHTENFFAGIVTLVDVSYFLTAVFFWLILNGFALRKRN